MYKDYSQIVTFYASDYSKFQTLAKGVKTLFKLKGISGRIELFKFNHSLCLFKKLILPQIF